MLEESKQFVLTSKRLSHEREVAKQKKDLELEILSIEENNNFLKLMMSQNNPLTIEIIKQLIGQHLLFAAECSAKKAKIQEEFESLKKSQQELYAQNYEAYSAYKELNPLNPEDRVLLLEYKEEITGRLENALTIRDDILNMTKQKEASFTEMSDLKEKLSQKYNGFDESTKNIFYNAFRQVIEPLIQQNHDKALEKKKLELSIQISSAEEEKNFFSLMMNAANPLTDIIIKPLIDKQLHFASQCSAQRSQLTQEYNSLNCNDDSENSLYGAYKLLHPLCSAQLSMEMLGLKLSLKTRKDIADMENHKAVLTQELDELYGQMQKKYSECDDDTHDLLCDALEQLGMAPMEEEDGEEEMEVAGDI